MAEAVGTVGAFGAAMQTASTKMRKSLQIALNLNDFEFALYELNGRINSFKDVILSISPPEPTPGSPAITSFAEALSEIVLVAESIEKLFAADAASYKNAMDAKIEQDNILAAQLRNIGLAASGVVGGAVAASTGSSTASGAASVSQSSSGAVGGAAAVSTGSSAASDAAPGSQPSSGSDSDLSSPQLTEDTLEPASAGTEMPASAQITEDAYTPQEFTFGSDDLVKSGDIAYVLGSDGQKYFINGGLVESGMMEYTIDPKKFQWDSKVSGFVRITSTDN